MDLTATRLGTVHQEEMEVMEEATVTVEATETVEEADRALLEALEVLEELAE